MTEVSSRWLPAAVEPTSVVPADGFCLWQRFGEGLAGWGEAARFEVPAGEDRFAVAEERLRSFFETLDIADDVGERGPIAFGTFTFDRDAAGSHVVVPEVVVGRRAGRSWVTRIGPGEPPAIVPQTRTSHPMKIRYAGSTVSELEWIDSVGRALKSIQRGDLEKVVLSRDLIVWSEEDLDIPLLLHRLARRFRECYTFAIDGFVGATPELLVSRRGSKVASLVLAGTAPRGEGSDDHALGDALLASEKDRHEHEVSVRSVVERLRSVCDDVVADPRPHLLKLSNVQHLATSVSATAPDGWSSLRIAGALHPTAAVCGTPAHDAAGAIRDLEGFERGRYTGPVGWMDMNGNGEWGIALRCAELGARRGRLFAGGGIVRGSRPEAELEETRVKFRAMLSVLEES